MVGNFFDKPDGSLLKSQIFGGRENGKLTKSWLNYIYATRSALMPSTNKKALFHMKHDIVPW